MNVLFLCLVVAVFLSLYVNGQVLEGLPCQVNNVKSQCVSIQDCEAVKQELLKPQLTQETKNFLKSLSCGFANNNYYVCCPQRISSASNPQQTLSAATNEELYRQKFLVAPQCGLANVSLPRVVGGVPTKPGDFPWLVALGYQNKQNPSIPRWLCGGSLITYKHVLTAAHCIRNDLYVVRAGEYNLYSDNDGAQPLDLRIAKMTIYEGYNKSRASNDIALLTLERNIEGYHQIRPICLPWEPEIRTKSFLADTLYIIGWGQVQFRGPSSEIPLIASLKELPIDYCSRVYSSVADIDDRIMCVGDIQYKKDACSGDSGGPLMYSKNLPDQSHVLYQVAVVSYGHKCAEVGYPGVYTRVTKFLDWIVTNID
ncbi:venom protease-like [Anthonomus grandis grandis]|uniref:venom protease-like n=1 Tax=Anthonomus grandis grandis TaxID=2921223 RepID=UPI002165970B|nr:venom protease-like [Anthonomus grandis grandis]